MLNMGIPGVSTADAHKLSSCHLSQPVFQVMIRTVNKAMPKLNLAVFPAQLTGLILGKSVFVSLT
jgi:hypothetical protein